MRNAGGNVNEVSRIKLHRSPILYRCAANLSRAHDFAILNLAAGQESRFPLNHKKKIGILLVNLSPSILVTQRDHRVMVPVLFEPYTRRTLGALRFRFQSLSLLENLALRQVINGGRLRGRRRKH